MAITKVSAALADLDGAVVINESSADVDFRVESNGNANMLFVDGGNDKIGIGTNAPAEQLHVLGDSAKIQIESNGSDTGVQLVLDGAKTSNGAIGDIVFENAGDTVGMIRANRTGANDAADMLFYTQATGGSNSEKMRLTTSGDLCLGGTNEVHTSADIGTSLHILSETAGTDVSVHLHPDTGEWSLYAYDGYFSIIDHTANKHRFQISATTDTTFSSTSGDCRLNMRVGTTRYWNMAVDTAGSPGSNAFWIGDEEDDNGVYVAQDGSSWSGISDERLKRNWTNIENATDKIKTLTKVGTFQRRGKTTGNWSDNREVGLSAQEVEAILPEAVTTGGDIEFASDDKVTGVKGMAYEKLVPLLVKSIQELEARIATLEG